MSLNFQRKPAIHVTSAIHVTATELNQFTQKSKTEAPIRRNDGG